MDHDHDGEPVTYKCERIGHVVDLATFSRKREINPYSTRPVMG